MRKWIAFMLVATLLLSCLPMAAMAKKNTQMNDGVPVWTEETVRDYALAYVKGKVMNTLYGYYDLQIRRYIPMTTFESLLTEFEWMTGAFQALGSYSCFSTPENQTKTHVLHFCMEKTDLDMYFTHKDKEDDWEIMALEFVPAAEEPLPDGSDMLVGGTEAADQVTYDEVSITIGSAQNAVSGILTIPHEASESNPVPGCVFVHDWGALDRDETMGNTKLFADLAKALAEMGIASIRYDKRSYAHEVDANTTIDNEVVNDALAACDLMLSNNFIDQKRVVLVGHGFGAMVAPLIASQDGSRFTAMVMIGGSMKSFLQQIVDTSVPDTDKLTAEEMQALQNLADTFASVKKAKAAELTILGRNGNYFYELGKLDQVKTIKKLKLPTYILQGDSDPCVSEDDGWRGYAEAIGDGATYMSFKSFQGLNHLLMAQTTLTADDRPDYSVAATLDAQAGKNISQWILNLLMQAE